MSKGKLLFATAEGIGNVIQTIPTIRTLNECLGFEIDLWHAFGSFPIPKVIPYVDKWFVGGNIQQINIADYVGKVSSDWTKNHVNSGILARIPLLATANKTWRDRSESDTYMDIARKLGVTEEDILWHGFCDYKRSDETFDLVIHDGYNRNSSNTSWALKSYPYYKEVVKLLGDLKICSVGGRGEWIEGTENRTGISLLDTLGIIKNSRLFLGNDSGLYHCANALGASNIVIFTYTSTIKNYDKRFHKYSTVLQNYDLDCLSCQNLPRFKTCTKRLCREIEPEIVAYMVMEKLNG